LKANQHIFKTGVTFGTTVDGDEANGHMFISPYIYATKRAETPGFEFSKYEQPVMFEKYWASVKKLLTDSRQL